MVVRLALTTCLAAALLLSHAACSGGGSGSGSANNSFIPMPRLKSKPKTTISKTDDIIVVQRGQQRTVILRPDSDEEAGN